MDTELGIAHRWTVGEMARRLGISSAVFERVRFGAREVGRIAEAGIRHVELGILPLDLRATPRSVDHRDGKQMREIKAACEAHGIQISTVHSPNLAYGAENQEERRAAVKEGLAVAHVAVELGACMVVCHFRINEFTERSIHELLDETMSLPVTLGAENLTDENSIKRVLTLVDGFNSDRLRMILDIGHELDTDGVNPFTVKDCARSAIVQCGGRVAHVHLHETLAHSYKVGSDGQPSYQHRDHQPPLHEDGMIEWEEVLLGLQDIDYQGVLLFEDGLCEDPQEFIDATASFPKRFVQRYRAQWSHPASM